MDDGMFSICSNKAHKTLADDGQVILQTNETIDEIQRNVQQMYSHAQPRFDSHKITPACLPVWDTQS
jgi:hypothetical protein